MLVWIMLFCSGTVLTLNADNTATNLPQNGLVLWLDGESFTVSEIPTHPVLWTDKSPLQNDGLALQPDGYMGAPTLGPFLSSLRNGYKTVVFNPLIFRFYQKMDAQKAAEHFIVLKATGTNTPFSSIFDQITYPTVDGQIQIFGQKSVGLNVSDWHLYNEKSEWKDAESGMGGEGFDDFWAEDPWGDLTMPTKSKIVYLNGKEVLFANQEYHAIGANPHLLGGLWHGEIAEVIVYERHLSDAERAEVERYLANKYALADVLVKLVDVPSDFLGNFSEIGVHLTWGGGNNGNAVQYIVERREANGEWTVIATINSLNYTDATAEAGKEYEYRIRGVLGDYSSNYTGIVSIQIPAIENAIPAAIAQSYSFHQDTAQEIILVGYDADGDPLSYAIVTSPEHGSLSGAIPNLTYTPNAGFNGTDKFAFKVNDGKADSEMAWIALTVYPPDADPSTSRLLISSPATDSTFITSTEIKGSALDPNFTRYELQYRPIPASGGTVEAWTTFAADNRRIGVGSTPGTLGILDPGMLRNGQYQLRILLHTTSAITRESAYATVTIDGQRKIGPFSVSFKDLSESLAGLPLEIVRTYDSRDRAQDGDFGHGWSLNLNTVTLRKNRSLDQGWSQTMSGGIFPTYRVAASARHLVSLSFPDGSMATFEASSSSSNAIYPLSEVQFTFSPVGSRTKGTLSFDGGATAYVAGGGTSATGPMELFANDYFSFIPYNPLQFKYTAPDGSVSIIHEQKGLLTHTDPQGNKLTLVRDAQGRVVRIDHSSGRGFVINRDVTTKRITSIDTPYGDAIAYGYDSSGDLVAVADRTEAVTEYSYYTGSADPREAHLGHFLKDVIDPNGTLALRNEYDEQGRLIKQTDALGNPVEYTHDTDTDVERVKDRLGYETAHSYDNEGNVTQTVQADGSIINYAFGDPANPTAVTKKIDPLGRETTYTYDSAGRIKSETNHLGEKTENTYNAQGNPTEAKDAKGNITKTEYKPGGNLPAKFTDPEGKAIVFDNYDARGNLTQFTDAEGRTTASIYDSADRLKTQTNPDGVLIENEYDSNGYLSKQTRSKDALVEITTYINDAEGRVLQTTHPDGTVSSTEYDAAGNPTKVIASDGSITLTDYDPTGNAIRTTYLPASITNGEVAYTEETIYDAEGRATHSKDKAGSWTRSYYDPMGRVIAIYELGDTLTRTQAEASLVGAGYPVSFSQYDAAGQLTDSYDALGYRTHYEYDDAGRRTQVTPPGTTPSSITPNAKGDGLVITHGADSLDNIRATVSAYDANGNLESFTDANGQVTLHYYDKNNRRIQTGHSDGTTTKTSYDGLGRVKTKTDAENKVITYGYHSGGQLASITDADGNATYYNYDSLGRQTEQIDAEGRKTIYTYNNVGRRETRRLPLGQSEVFTYYDDGKVKTRTDFNGKVTTYEYDGHGNLLKIKPATAALARGALGTVYRYDMAGRLIRTEQRDGSDTIRWAENYYYDYDGLLAKKETPAGSITYFYDARKNLEGIETSNGTKATYTYDAENRLVSVKDQNTRSTAYTYDKVGNLATISLPNGIVSTYGYNEVNRLKSITNKKGVGTVASFNYDLLPSGHREKLAENIGGASHLTEWSYDNLYRLTEEKVDGTASATYAYDKVGNRISRATAGIANLPSIGLYSYDWNDRLLSADTHNYSYDNNGNTLNGNIGTAGIDPLTGLPLSTKTVVDTYDHNNRLIKRTAPGLIVEIMYDAAGNRVAKTVNGITTYYLIDTQSLTGYAQVLEENKNSVVSKHYTYGHDLISQEVRQDDSTYKASFYSYDGLGSVRYLTNENGTITDHYTYDAYGTLLATWRSGSATDNNYLYAGEQYDPDLGLYYNRARYLNTDTGRFWTMDDYQGNNREPLSLHKYLYVHGDPVNGIDPSGKFLMNLISSMYVRSLLFTINHPMLAGVIGLVINLFIPEEVDYAMMNSGIPPFQGLSAIRRGEISLLKAIKNSRFVSWLDSKARGLIHNELGYAFEDFVFDNLLNKAATRQVQTVGRRSVDFDWRGRLIEIKNKLHLDSDDIKQLEAAVQKASLEGKSLVYIFLQKPTPSTVKKINDAGGSVMYFFE
ncbi:MAG: cadherin-like domain-containing protein [Puniceicoccales bacterium]|jgi:RHS repeat-associated protein|nr:cadherin-like domain-containing protein [Puniceicoccales bacterium]